MKAVETDLISDLLRQSMAQGTSLALRIVSDSMSPLLKTGDKIEIKPVEASALSPGDILLLRGPRDFVTHRYWGTVLTNGQPGLLTRGDRPFQFDQPWTHDDVVGKVVARRRKDKFMSLTTGRGNIANQLQRGLVALEIRWFRHNAPAGSSLPRTLRLPGWARGSRAHWLFRKGRHGLALVVSTLFARP